MQTEDELIASHVTLQCRLYILAKIAKPHDDISITKLQTWCISHLSKIVPNTRLCGKLTRLLTKLTAAYTGKGDDTKIVQILIHTWHNQNNSCNARWGTLLKLYKMMATPTRCV